MSYRRLRRHRPDEICLVNSVSVTDGRRVGLLVTFHHPSEDKAFRGTFLKWDTPEGWRKALERLAGAEPAKEFRFADLGADCMFSDMSVHYSGKYMLCLDAVRYVERRMANHLTAEGLAERNARAGRTGFVTEFGGSGIFDVADSDWHVSEMKMSGHRRPRVIY